MPTPAATIETVPAAARRLTRHDRCDSCGAQAFVEVTSAESGLVLLFCNHHTRKHQDALATSGFAFHDESDRLLDEIVKDPKAI